MIGAVGPPGPRGPAGPPGLANLEVVHAVSAMDSDSFKTAQVTCPGAKFSIGGGASLDGADQSIFTAPIRVFSQPGPIFGSALSEKLFSTGWYAVAAETAPYNSSWAVRVFAVCADASLAP